MSSSTLSAQLLYALLDARLPSAAVADAQQQAQHLHLAQLRGTLEREGAWKAEDLEHGVRGAFGIVEAVQVHDLAGLDVDEVLLVAAERVVPASSGKTGEVV